jgi:hypothetical protein
MTCHSCVVMSGGSNGHLEWSATEPSTVKVLILHEDMGSRCRAEVLFKELLRNFAGHLAFALDLCRFDLLDVLSEADSVRARALETDLLVVASSNPGNIPQGVTDWMEEWAVLRSGKDPVLLVLTGKGPGSPQPASRALKDLRARAMRLGVYCLEPWNLETSLACWSVAADLHQREQAVTPTLQRFMARSDAQYFRW